MNSGFLWAGITVAALVWLAGAPGWAVVGFGLIAGIAGNLHKDFLDFERSWNRTEAQRANPQYWTEAAKNHPR